MEASRELSRTPRRLPPCSDVMCQPFRKRACLIFGTRTIQARLPYWHQFGAAAVGGGAERTSSGEGGVPERELRVPRAGLVGCTR